MRIYKKTMIIAAAGGEITYQLKKAFPFSVRDVFQLWSFAPDFGTSCTVPQHVLRVNMKKTVM